MAIQVPMPKLGLLMTEGTIIEWLVPDGQVVKQDQPIVNIITQKINYEVVAPTGGVLYHAAQVNEKTQIGEPLAFVAAPDEPPPLIHRKIAGPRENQRPSMVTPVKPKFGNFVLASPWARLLARENGIDLVQVKGSGHNGYVNGRDVLRFNRQRRLVQILEQLPPTPPASPASEYIIPLTGIRRTIAERMAESLHTMAQATLNAEVDLTELFRLRRQAQLRPMPTHTELVIKAVALALAAHPHLNAVLLGDEIELLPDIHIGLAVPLQDGLLVPVVRHTNQRPLPEIIQETRRLIAAARAGDLTVDEVTGSTFTVTNLGVYGVDFFVPIINPPETAILGIGRIVRKPVIWRGQAASHPMLMLCLAFDHRVVDGARAGAFLRTVSRLLARPEVLFD
ncbi:MAG: Dihydrolipoyllysine-residue acetyltransferase component of pyruvate dehydrogenase complex [Anaerolineae bacterium]|nr:Dihydrolipoyllysine-residue acetyltransferase component of pyruvate dehydrogenase complex [Anaerolineae bacterium]